MWIVFRIMFSLMKNCHRHRRFRLPVELHENRAKDVKRLAHTSDRHRRSAINDGLQAAEVMLLAGDRIEQHIDHGGHHEGTCHLMSFDKLAEDRRFKPRVHDDCSRLHQHWHDQSARRVSDRRHREKPNLLRPVKVGHFHQGHRHMNPVGMHNALRFTGRSAGVDQHAWIVFRGRRFQSQRRVTRGLRKDVELPCPRPKAEQL